MPSAAYSTKTLLTEIAKKCNDFFFFYSTFLKSLDPNLKHIKKWKGSNAPKQSNWTSKFAFLTHITIGVDK